MQSPEGRICLLPAPSVAASCRPFVPNCSQLTACLYRNAKIPPIGRSGASAGPVEAHDLGTWRHRERHRTVRGVDCAASVIRSEMGIELNVFAPRQGYRLLLARNADAIVVGGIFANAARIGPCASDGSGLDLGTLRRRDGSRQTRQVGSGAFIGNNICGDGELDVVQQLLFSFQSLVRIFRKQIVKSKIHA